MSPAASIPPDQSSQQNENQERGGIVHRKRCHWPYSWQNENDADKEGPEASPGIDKNAESAHMPRPGLELAKDYFAEDGDAIAPVEGDCTDVEDTRDGCVRSESDEIDNNTPKHRDPDSINRCTGALINYSPDL